MDNLNVSSSESKHITISNRDKDGQAAMENAASQEESKGKNDIQTKGKANIAQNAMNFESYLQEKSKRWKQFVHKKYVPKQKFGLSEMSKKKLPQEVLRKIIKDHGDMPSKKFKQDIRVYLGALNYVPHVVYKLSENMSFPWE